MDIGIGVVLAEVEALDGGDVGDGLDDVLDGVLDVEALGEASCIEPSAGDDEAVGEICICVG